MIIPLLVIVLIVTIYAVCHRGTREDHVLVIYEDSRGGKLIKMPRRDVTAVLDQLNIVGAGTTSVNAQQVHTALANIRNFLFINGCMDPELQDLEAKILADVDARVEHDAERNESQTMDTRVARETALVNNEPIHEYLRVLKRQLETCPCTRGKLNLQLLQKLSRDSAYIAPKVISKPAPKPTSANLRGAFTDAYDDDDVLDKYNIIRSSGGMWDTYKFDRPLTLADVRVELSTTSA